MSKLKTILIILGIAAFATGLSLFFKGDGALFGSIPDNVAGRGFPFHFYEGVYKEATHINLISQRLLMFWLLGNVLVYFIILFSLKYLLIEGYIKHNWFMLGAATILGAIFLLLSILKPNYCVTGFPIEFYLKCEGYISQWFVIFGWIFDSIFWFSLAAILVSVSYKFFKTLNLKRFLIYKDFWLTISSACVVTAILCIPCMFASGATGVGFFFALLGTGFVFAKARDFYKNLPKGSGEKFFFSKLGYIALGVSLGSVIISTVFNISYSSGWFDFTDIGFYFISYPLIAITHFQPDTDIFSKRIILYITALINLTIMTLVLDIVGVFLEKIYKIVKKIVIKK